MKHPYFNIRNQKEKNIKSQISHWRVAVSFIFHDEIDFYCKKIIYLSSAILREA